MISIILAIASMALVVFMSWRILEKTGLPGWLALVHLLALTGIGMLASLLFFWVLAFIRWPRDEQVAAHVGTAHREERQPERLAHDERQSRHASQAQRLEKQHRAPK